MKDYLVLITLGTYVVFLIALIFSIARLTIWIYRRGLTDRTLLPSTKDVTEAVLKMFEDSTEKVAEKKKKMGRYST